MAKAIISIIRNHLNLNILTIRVFKGSFFNLLSSILTNFTKIFIIFILSRFFIKEEFGLWVTITSITAILATGDFGIGNSVRNKLSQLNIKSENNDEARKYFLVSLYILSIFVVLVIFLFLAFKDFIPYSSLFKTGNDELKEVGSSIIFLVQIILILGIPLGLSNACFYSYHETKVVATLSIIQSLLSLLIIFLLSISNVSIIYISIFYFLSFLVLNLLSTIIFIYRRNWSLKISIIKEKVKFIEILKSGYKFFILQILIAYVFNSATILISSNISLSMSSEYNVIQKLYVFGIGIYQSIFNPLWGGFGTALAVGNIRWIKKMFLFSNVLTFVIFILFAFFMYFFGNVFVAILAGNDYMTSKYLIFIVGINSLFYIMFNCALVLQNASNKLNVVLVVLIILSILLSPLANTLNNYFGVSGIIYSLIIINMVLFFSSLFHGIIILNRLQYENN